MEREFLPELSGSYVPGLISGWHDAVARVLREYDEIP